MKGKVTSRESKGIKKITGNPFSVFFFVVLMFLTGNISLAQQVTVMQDTLKVTLKQVEATSDLNRKGGQGNMNETSGSRGKGSEMSAIKRIKSARPDMSKARGARPPVISRPAGKGIPKGIGKPKGAGKKVGG